MPTKTGLTPAQHIELGHRLARMQDEINDAISLIGQAYLSNGREVKALEKTGRVLEATRVILADSVCDGMSSREASDAYYPDDAGRSGVMRWSA
jgi:hypothetical protein